MFHIVFSRMLLIRFYNRVFNYNFLITIIHCVINICALNKMQSYNKCKMWKAERSINELEQYQTRKLATEIALRGPINRLTPDGDTRRSRRPSNTFAETVYFVPGNETSPRDVPRETRVTDTNAGKVYRFLRRAKQRESSKNSPRGAGNRELVRLLYPASRARLLGTITLFFPLYRSAFNPR